MEVIQASSGGERTILVSVSVQILEDPDADEFHLLAESAGAQIVQHLKIQRQKPDAKFFIGSGKTLEIAEMVLEHEIDIVMFDHSLSPAQERNLERALNCRVIDRTGLILDIFAQRARTYEGKLQVELAQLQHLASRLIRSRGTLDSQKGGIGLRGPGETLLETDRRLLRIRTDQLKARLEKVRQTRQQGRVARQKAAVPTVSLVGYTNAGKSTLFNLLAQSDVYAANQLFATLDPTLRRLQWDGIGNVVLADTVGFVRNLSHSLVESFKATLEETLEATLLLHVIDSSSEEVLEQIDAVEKVLKEIGVDVPILRVYNKIDQSGEDAKILYNEQGQPERVYLSAHSGAGVPLLHEAVQACLLGQHARFTLQLQPAHGKLRHQLYQLNVIESEHYDDVGTLHLVVHMAPAKLEQVIRQAHIPLIQVLGEQAKRFEKALEEFEISNKS